MRSNMQQNIKVSLQEVWEKTLGVPVKPVCPSVSQFVPAEKNTRQSADEGSAAKWKTTREATISFDLRR